MCYKYGCDAIDDGMFTAAEKLKNSSYGWSHQPDAIHAAVAMLPNRTFPPINLCCFVKSVSFRCIRCDGLFECLIVSTIDSGHCAVRDDREEGWPEAVLVG